jgi:hypothetical protein
MVTGDYKLATRAARNRTAVSEGFEMSDLKLLEEALDRCKGECEAIDSEMDRLLAESRAETEVGREFQRVRFEELTARKAEAARRLLATEKAIRTANWQNPAH